jgi:hypothetical protein
MPPAGAGNPLAEEQIVTIARWVDLGMPAEAPDVPRPATAILPKPKVSDRDRQFWPFVKPVRPSVPAVKDARRVRTAIDAFVLAALEAKGLTFAPDSSKQALMRRDYFDLLGLPPSPEQVQTFLADNRPDAYERLVDQLMASPHYGERWGRAWLDVAGYTDTDELVDWRNAPRYTPDIRDALIATGYLRNVVDKRGQTGLFMQMEAISSGLLGLRRARVAIITSTIRSRNSTTTGWPRTLPLCSSMKRNPWRSFSPGCPRRSRKRSRTTTRKSIGR